MIGRVPLSGLRVTPIAVLLAIGVVSCRDPNSAQAIGDFRAAVQQDQLEAVRSWLDAGLNPNLTPEGDCSTPLAVAAMQQQAEMVSLLVQRRASVDAPAGPDGRTALACVSGLEVDAGDMIVQLLGLGAAPDVPAADGKTALMLAAERGHLDSVSALLEEKADPNYRLATGITAVDLAIQGGYRDVVALLVKAGGRPPASQPQDNVPVGPGAPLVVTSAGNIVPGETYEEARPKLETGLCLDTFHKSPTQSIESWRINGTEYRFIFEREKTGPFRLVRIEPQ